MLQMPFPIQPAACLILSYFPHLTSSAAGSQLELEDRGSKPVRSGFSTRILAVNNKSSVRSLRNPQLRICIGFRISIHCQTALCLEFADEHFCRLPFTFFLFLTLVFLFTCLSTPPSALLPSPLHLSLLSPHFLPLFIPNSPLRLPSLQTIPLTSPSQIFLSLKPLCLHLFLTLFT